MDNLKMHTPNLADENFRKLAALFPNAVTEVIVGYEPELDENGQEKVGFDGKAVMKPIVERAIDKDVLMQEISAHVVEGREERYQFTWPDKKKAMLAANAPISATLRPVRADSVGKDGTPGGWDSENLYIEGDNLDVLKLLQETYLGKVKMIYIDPPYNTGNDFVYADDFAEDADSYLERSGQFDDQGNRLEQNTESNGRFHTDWLNLIYSRLKICKPLLANNGVILISINEEELNNLVKCLDEIFGETNRIGIFCWLSKSGGGSDNGFIVNDQEYVVCYCKTIDVEQSILNKIEIVAEPLDKEDEMGRYRVGRELNKWGANSRREDRPTMFFPIPGPNGEVVYPIRNDGTEGRWRLGKPAMMEMVQNGNCEFISRGDGTYIVYEKIRTEENRLKPYRTFIQDSGTTADGTKEVKALFNDKKVFDFPKPLKLIKHLIQISCSTDSLILDFFSGSSTTAHAVMQLNAEDGGHRKFIMIQLPEKTDESSEAYKAGYKNICEIGKERIRRAGRKIKEEAGMTAQDLDIGFRVLRLDSSNMQDVYYNPAAMTQTMLDTTTNNIKPDRTPEDLLFQVMLDLGVDLSSPIQETSIDGKKVFAVAGTYLLACFDPGVTTDTVTAIAKQRPYYAVFRDSSMANDSVATNFDQIFETYSPGTVRRVL